MKYIEYLNAALKARVANEENLVIFGQNIAAGSCLSGLTRGLNVSGKSLVINTPNSENTLCGIGFGAMLSGANAIFFMKQLDFLFLGIDHIFNTYNILRRKAPQTSFTVFPVIVDSGYEGPQASANNLSDFCSLANVEGYTLVGKADIDAIVKSRLITPGFRIICASQRLFKTELIETLPIFISEDQRVYQYAAGSDVTVVCFNLSLPQGLEFNRQLTEKGISAELFSVHEALPGGWNKILESVARTRRLIILDDSKSVNTASVQLENKAMAEGPLAYKKIIRRDLSGYHYRPHSDQFTVDSQAIILELSLSPSELGQT